VLSSEPFTNVGSYRRFGTGNPGSVSLGALELTFFEYGKMPGSGVPSTRWIGVSMAFQTGRSRSVQET
jgi:hypothetical protein